jgi:hypothetical protein
VPAAIVLPNPRASMIIRDVDTLSDTTDRPAATEQLPAADEATDNQKQQETQVVLVQRELDRANTLVPKRFEMRETHGQRQQQLNGAIDA